MWWWILGIPVWILSGWPLYWSIRRANRRAFGSWTKQDRLFFLSQSAVVGPTGWPVSVILFLVSTDWPGSDEPAKW